MSKRRPAELAACLTLLLAVCLGLYWPTTACADQTSQPPKTFPDIRGLVIDGTLDTSKPLLEEFARSLLQYDEAMKAGDKDRLRQLKRSAESNIVNVAQPTRPIPHASVTLYNLSSDSPRRFEKTVKADAEGKFGFFDIPRGCYRIVAQDLNKGPNFGKAVELTMEHYHQHDNIRLVIYPQTITLKGRVTDSGGHPVPDVMVAAKQGHEDYETEGDFTRYYHETTSRTDSEGRYAIKGLLPADVWHAGALANGGYGDKDICYVLKIAANGYVPVKAIVPVVPEETRQTAKAFFDILTGRESLYQKADRSERKGAPVTQPVCHGYTLSCVDFILNRPASISGAVVNKQGVPQKDCSVHLLSTNQTERLSCLPRAAIPWYVSTGANGAFMIENVPPDTYEFRVYEDGRCVSGRSPVRVTVEEGISLTGVRLEHDALPFGRIEGVVIDAASGKPVKGFSLYVAEVTGSTEYVPSCGRWKSSCLCGQKGCHTDACNRWLQTNDTHASAFILENISPGKAELVVQAPGYAEEHALIDVAPDEVAKPNVRLWRAGTARIKSVIKEGARVDFYASLPREPPLVRYVAVPDEGGRCVHGGNPSQQAGYDDFLNIKPGHYTIRGEIRYLPDDVMRYETAPVVIESDRTSETTLDFNGPCGLRLELGFSPGTAISIRLETADTPSDKDFECNPGLRATAYFREPGTFLIPDLKPGVYRLSLFRWKVPSDKGPVGLKSPDQVRTITLNGTDQPSLAFHF